jgi:hypothetical protein
VPAPAAHMLGAPRSQRSDPRPKPNEAGTSAPSSTRHGAATVHGHPRHGVIGRNADARPPSGSRTAPARLASPGDDRRRAGAFPVLGGAAALGGTVSVWCVDADRVAGSGCCCSRRVLGLLRRRRGGHHGPPGPGPRASSPACPCMPVGFTPKDRQQLMYSRMLGATVSTSAEMRSVLAQYAAAAARRLRAHGLDTALMQVWISSSRFRDDVAHHSAAVAFDPTAGGRPRATAQRRRLSRGCPTRGRAPSPSAS